MIPDDLVNLRFAPDMAEALLAGRKTKTSRAEDFGEGRICLVQGRYFRITRVWPTALSTVRRNWYREEGFTSPEAFELRWRQLHRGHFNPEKIVFIHTLQEVNPE